MMMLNNRRSLNLLMNLMRRRSTACLRQNET